MPDRSALALQLTDAIRLARAAVEHAGDRAFRAYGLSHRAHAVLSAVDLGGPDGAGPKDVAAQGHGRGHGMRPVRQAVGAERPVAGVLHGGPCQANGVGELQGESGTIRHTSSVVRSALSVMAHEVNMLIINILNISEPARQPSTDHEQRMTDDVSIQQVSDQSTGDVAPQRTHLRPAGLAAKSWR